MYVYGNQKNYEIWPFICTYKVNIWIVNYIWNPRNINTITPQWRSFDVITLVLLQQLVLQQLLNKCYFCIIFKYNAFYVFTSLLHLMFYKTLESSLETIIYFFFPFYSYDKISVKYFHIILIFHFYILMSF